jgi:hypothetical protein
MVLMNLGIPYKMVDERGETTTSAGEERAYA